MAEKLNLLPGQATREENPFRNPSGGRGFLGHYRPLLLVFVSTTWGAAMASSIIGVSSVYQTTALELSRRTSAHSLSLTFSDKTLLGVLKAPNARLLSDASLRRSFKQGVSFVPSAIATPNSVLSEEAFKGLGGFHKEDPLDVTDADEDYETEIEASAAAQEDELALANLGLPPRLVQSLQQRGITHLFPIQVCIYMHFVLVSLKFNVFQLAS